MPLGIQQNNDFTQFTMDVWNDKIFYQEKEFPAGFMAMSILNIPEEKLPELIQAGGAPTFLFPVVVQGSDEEAAAVFPQLRERILYLTELLWKYPPFCYNDYEKEMRRINILFDERNLLQIRTPDSEFQTEFLRFCVGIIRIPIAMYHFYAAGRFFELDYLRRLKNGTKRILPWPRMTASTASSFGMRCGVYRAWIWSRSRSARSCPPPMCLPAVLKTKKKWCLWNG